MCFTMKVNMKKRWAREMGKELLGLVSHLDAKVLEVKDNISRFTFVCSLCLLYRKLTERHNRDGINR